MAKLQVVVNHIDYTLVSPGDLDHSSLPRVPVLRIFGPSSTGKNTCIHIHQVYPYFYVEYSGNLGPQYVNRYISTLFRSLNYAIALSLKRNPSKSQFIRAIVLVKGIPFYGFHASYTPFLKILIADPTYTNRIVAILQSGSVMSTRFRVLESHLSYILQFLCDFGLYGCGLLELEEVLERCPDLSEEQVENDPSSKQTHFPASSYFRESRLPLEVDAIAPHILNRHRLSPRKLHHRLNIPAPPLSTEPLVLSVRELWEDERNHRLGLGLNPSPEIPSDPSESSRAGGGEWIAEARWWDELRKRIENEDAVRYQVPFDSDWDRFVMTTFESVEAIWESQYKHWKPSSVESKNSHRDKVGQDPEYSWEVKITSDLEDKVNEIEVDISMLSNEEINVLDEQEAQDWNKEAFHEYLDMDHMEEGAETLTYEEEDIGDSDGVVVAEAASPQDPFLEVTETVDDQATTDYKLQSPPNLNTPHLSPHYRDGSPTPTKQLNNFMNPFHEQLQVIARTSFNEDVKPHNQISNNEQCASTGEADIYLTVNEVDISDSPSEKVTFDARSASQRSSFISARAVQLSKVYQTCNRSNTNRYEYAFLPPSRFDLLLALETPQFPNKVYRAPYYSNESDVPEMLKEYAGFIYDIKGGHGIAMLEQWSACQIEEAIPNALQLITNGVGGWEYAGHPPSVKEVRRTASSLKDRTAGNIKANLRSLVKIDGPTQANIYGFKTSPLVDGSSSREKPNMTILSVEVFAPTFNNIPNPESDEIAAVFYAHHESASGSDITHFGAFALNNSQLDSNKLRQLKFEIVDTELDLLNGLVDKIIEIDPDILTGWEVQMGSWGYLEARSMTHGISFSDLICRAPPRHSSVLMDQWGFRKTSTFKVAGRHVLNLWRIMRNEKTLPSYTFENVVFDVLRRRVPKYNYQTLTDWYFSPVPTHVSLLFQYFSTKTSTNLELLEEAEIVTKTAEFARVFGVDFFSVLNRGSQFKVESFLFRIGKAENFVFISPTKQDVGKQNAAECMPLIMEPASAFYSSPVLVLDFQSLYPSIMIAYNYCYSTCVGRITDFKGAHKFGVIDDLKLTPGLLNQLQGHITVAPNGIMYVQPTVRRGLLGRMLIELLNTRVMVKQAMKRVGIDKARKRILDARQLGLKYIANVTYGYTGATFSGRMPAVEIADSIVQSGRETLEKAIDIINNTEKWGGKVVYGDTDSVFIHLPGKTKEQAFSIGNEIADVITALNPAPVKLKFEKVYLPCVLMAKKRYVGFKFESVDDTEPVFDAKGIETVRRDGILAQRKMVEKCLKILFRTQNLSEVKEYCCRSWTNLLENKASVQDFIFAKEVRMGTYSEKGPPLPGVVVAARKTVIDPSDEAQYGDRIPYVIVRSTSGAKLVDRAMDPLEFLDDSQLRLDSVYYITRVLIPPLERIFNLLGADVKQWFNEMPKTIVPELLSPKKPKIETIALGSPDKMNIEEHFLSTQCLSCGGSATQSICDSCWFCIQGTVANLESRIGVAEGQLVKIHRICATCTGSPPLDTIHCVSLDCPWFFARRKVEEELGLSSFLGELSAELNELDNDNKDETDHEGDEGSLEYYDVTFVDEVLYTSDLDAGEKKRD